MPRGRGFSLRGARDFRGTQGKKGRPVVVPSCVCPYFPFTPACRRAPEDDVNKAELIEVISDHLGDRRAAKHAVEAVVDTITRTVAKGEKVAISGFGVFERLERPARIARNPATGAQVRVRKTSV